MASFEEINYNLRPNKSIERKMIGETLHKLTYINNLSNYRYIGFGSTYFTDFILFHKSLGINKMVSIEKEESKKPRFEFNKPFTCVDMHYGAASTVLPNLELEKSLNVIWLDYDGKIQDYVFSDIDTVVSNSLAGTVFLVSINVEPYYGKKDERMAQLIEAVGNERIPSHYMDVNLGSNNHSAVVYDMIDRQIKKSLLERNGGNTDKLDYLQLFHYWYKDGASMLTVGGLLFDEKQKKQIKKMNLEDIKHLSNSQEMYKIQCPNLTYKEVHTLNNLMPCELQFNDNGYILNREFKKLPLNHIDIKNFAEVYRYYPNFAETTL